MTNDDLKQIPVTISAYDAVLLASYLDDEGFSEARDRIEALLDEAAPGWKLDNS